MSLLSNTLNKQRGALITVLLAILFVNGFYGEVLFNPNSYLFSAQGDGIKNYFSYVSYIDNNKLTSNFNQISYPYGEHFLYMDCFPSLVVLMKLGISIVPSLSQYNIGVVNFLILLSFVLSALFIYLILKQFKVKETLAVGGAICIMYLTPQVLRMTGHMALSFGCFLPISWYLLLKFERSDKKLKYVILNLLNGIFWIFMHAYLGAILASFIIAYSIVKITPQLKNKSINWHYYKWIAIQSIGPLLIYFIYVKSTDTHISRTTNPFGFFFYCADLDTVFIASRPPLGPLFKSILPPYRQTWEGISYVGIVSIISLGILVFATIKRWLKKASYNFQERYFEDVHLRTMLIGSFIVFMFSMAYPFRWNMHGLLEYFGFLKQFRSPGRFAWVFFLVLNISSIVLIDRMLKTLIANQKKAIAYLIISLTFSFYLIEGFSAHQSNSEKVTNSVNLFDLAQVDEEINNAINAIDKKNYQAIIPFPYYCHGSENFERINSERILPLSKTISYHTSLPIMAAHSARTSITESKNLQQLLTKNYYHKALQEDIVDNRDFLLVVTNELLSDNEQSILQKAKHIKTLANFKILSISKQDLFKDESDEEINLFKSVQDSLIENNGFLSTDSTFLFYNNFERNPSDIHFRGSGAYYGKLKDWHTLAFIPKGKLAIDTEYIFRFWMYIGGENNGQGMLNGMIVAIAQKNETEKWSDVTDLRSCETINGDWAMMEHRFIVTDVEADIKLALKGNSNSNKNVYVDEVVVYKKGVTHYRNNQSTTTKELFKNNHRISFTSAE